MDGAVRVLAFSICARVCVCLNGSLPLLLNYVKAELPGEPPPRTVVYLSLLPFLL